jgi:hypothetical protein
MSSPITHAEIARAAIRYVRASRARARHEQGIDWMHIDKNDYDRELRVSNDLTDEVVSARTALYGLVGRYDAQEER